MMKMIQAILPFVLLLVNGLNIFLDDINNNKKEQKYQIVLINFPRSCHVYIVYLG